MYYCVVVQEIWGGVNVVYILQKESIVLALTHHVTPGVTVYSSGFSLTPPSSSFQKTDTHTHTRTVRHSDTHNGLLVMATECTGSLLSRFG